MRRSVQLASWRVSCAMALIFLTNFAGEAVAGENGPVFSTIVVQPLISPRPVAGADGRVHLAYELSIVNDSKLLAQIDSIAAIDADTGSVLAEWKDKKLAEVFPDQWRRPGDGPGSVSFCLRFPGCDLSVERDPSHSDQASRFDHAVDA